MFSCSFVGKFSYLCQFIKGVFAHICCFNTFFLCYHLYVFSSIVSFLNSILKIFSCLIFFVFYTRIYNLKTHITLLEKCTSSSKLQTGLDIFCRTLTNFYTRNRGGGNICLEKFYHLPEAYLTWFWLWQQSLAYKGGGIKTLLWV